MLSAKELWLNYHKMCDTYDNCSECSACLDHENNDILCVDMERVDEFIEVVEKWSKDNPIVTNRQKFKEVFGYNNFAKSSQCEAYIYKACNSIENGRIPCLNCPWWDEEYKEVIK